MLPPALLQLMALRALPVLLHRQVLPARTRVQPLLARVRQCRLVLSGFHDSTGDPARNAELAKQRAFAVRDALIAEGVAEGSIDLQKPEAMPNTQGNDPEARRVEVKID